MNIIRNQQDVKEMLEMDKLKQEIVKLKNENRDFKRSICRSNVAIGISIVAIIPVVIHLLPTTWQMWIHKVLF